MSLSAAVWPQFATHVFGAADESLRYIGSYVNKKEITFTFSSLRTQAVRSASPSDIWALVWLVTTCLYDGLF